MKLIGRLAINAFALLIVAYIVPGFTIIGIWPAIVAAIVMGIINVLVKPILQIIALPITILTFGLAAFLINVFLLYWVSFLVKGFILENLFAAVVGSIALSIVSWFLNLLASD